MSSRTIVIGDVHGCSDELQDLLKILAPTPEDQLVSVGDLICKGPDSRGVMEWAMNAGNLRCVLGNHELRHLSHWKRGSASEEKPYDAETTRQLGERREDCMRFIARWPLYLVASGCTVVHAGFDPRGGPLSRQAPEDLVNMRDLKTTGKPWYEGYKEPRLVVFGHWAKKEPVVRDNAIGLDTGCVYGGSLTALILPERRLVSVPARRAYAEKKSWNAPALTGNR